MFKIFIALSALVDFFLKGVLFLVLFLICNRFRGGFHFFVRSESRFFLLFSEGFIEVIFSGYFEIMELLLFYLVFFSARSRYV